ncbi:MAG: ABC transporter ATP-binding protein [Trebonia sp.]
MTPSIEVSGLTRRYREHVALDDVHLTVGAGTITGLLGRNGAGKTTLLRIIAGHEFPSAGSVRVLGASPVADEEVLRRPGGRSGQVGRGRTGGRSGQVGRGRTVFVREDQAYPDFKVRHALRAASWCYPDWDASLASTLLDDFALPLDRAVKKLSRGMRSALGITIGLAAQAEITLFDEPYAGLDAVARQVFYDRLLADYAANPRTIVLSTHLIDEAAALFENIVVIDRGRVVLEATADGLRGMATTVSGPVLAVDSFTSGRAVWHKRRLGSQASVVMVGPLTQGDRENARSMGLDLTPLTLQQLVVHAAGWPDGSGGEPLAAPVGASLTERTSA